MKTRSLIASMVLFLIAGVFIVSAEGSGEVTNSHRIVVTLLNQEPDPVRPGNYVLIVPYEYESDRKGDIVYMYRDMQVNWLKNNNYLKDLIEQNEF